MAMDKIEHVVLLMMENRSFDSLLGWLYDDKKAPAKHIPPLKPGERPYEGLHGLSLKDWENVDETGTIRSIPIRGARGLGIPNVAPGETFTQVNTQLFGKENPAPPQDTPTMRGYVRDFTKVLRKLYPDDEAKVRRFADQVMQGFTPDQLPVLNGLAEHYAVCDMWFSSVPSQTNPNRAFALCGTSMGLVDNGFLEEDPRRVLPEKVFDAPLGDDRFKTKTIFNALEEGGKTTWKIFLQSGYLQDNIYKAVNALELGGAAVSVYGARVVPLVALAGIIVKFVGEDSAKYLKELSSPEVSSSYTYRLFPEILKVKNANSHFAKLDEFHTLARAGQLPNFSYIEPEWTIAHFGTGGNLTDKTPLFHQGNDYHPPGNLDAAENLVKQVYNSLIANQQAWGKTLLIITFDEPVGSFDHVPPPYKAIAPWPNIDVNTYQDGSRRVVGKGKGKKNLAGTASQDTAAGGFVTQHNFDFYRYGGRVPAILVSPLVEKGTVFRSEQGTVVPFDHTSLIATILKWRGQAIPRDFGIRTGNAPTFDKVVSLNTPRTDETEVRFLKVAHKVGEPVRFFDRFYLKDSEGRYISGFKEHYVVPYSITSEDPNITEYFPILQPTRSTQFYFQHADNRPDAGVITANGSTQVRLVAVDDGLGAYGVLGAWRDSHDCYYFNDYLEGDNDKRETWVLIKRGDLELRFGDRVLIENKFDFGLFQGGAEQRLTPCSSHSGYLTTGKTESYWTIEPVT